MAWPKRKTNSSGELWCKGCRSYHPAELFSPQGQGRRAQECRESRNRRIVSERASRLVRVEAACKRCGTIFTGRRMQKFCTVACKRKSGEERRIANWIPATKVCKWCLCEFVKTGPLHIFCTTRCKDLSQNVRRRKGRKQSATVTLKCQECGAEVTKLQRFYTRKLPKFCSPKCCYMSRRGHKSPLHRGTAYKTRGADWKETAKVIRARDGNVCVACGLAGEGRKLSVDHIIPYRLMIQWDINPNAAVNLASLCINCHPVKTAHEVALLAGDVVGFLSGLRWMHYPDDRVRAACEYASLPWAVVGTQQWRPTEQEFDEILGIGSKLGRMGSGE